MLLKDNQRYRDKMKQAAEEHEAVPDSVHVTTLRQHVEGGSCSVGHTTGN